VLLALAVLPIGFQLRRSGSAAYASGACVGLAIGWLTMPLFGLKVTTPVWLGVGAVLLVIGACAGWVAFRRAAEAGRSAH
jgi:F0F1-type ATP synthase assembly protein I